MSEMHALPWRKRGGNRIYNIIKEKTMKTIRGQQADAKAKSWGGARKAGAIVQRGEKGWFRDFREGKGRKAPRGGGI